MEAELAEIAKIKADTLASVGADFDNLDINKDGMVSREELKSVTISPGAGSTADSETIDGFFKQFDTTGDGKVSR